MRLSRRAMLAGAGSTLANAAFAQAPLSSLRPVARVVPRDAISKMVANAGISGDVGVVVVDAATGVRLEDISGDIAQPPASVTKAVTALYALENLGGAYRFDTRVFYQGSINNGILDGNLILAGGGDPTLGTDDLATLASLVKDTGLHEVRGDFLVWDEALNNLYEIDDTQLDYLGYNPSVTGLNLNFNRVHFEWKREDDNFTIAMDARSANYQPAVTVAKMQIVDRTDPVWTYRDVGDVDHWTVARGALNDFGSRWLPVRHPALYAGEVFATFMRSHGIALKTPKETVQTPTGEPLAAFSGAPLPDVMRGMLRFSTNLTAEASGLTATAARTGSKRGLAVSALNMARWASDRCGGIAPVFVDHSGLGDESRISPADMVQLLTARDVRPTLAPIMREIRLVGDDDQVIQRGQMAVRAKTGTLNFVSTLAGYVRTENGRDLAFAIFASDIAAREAGKLTGVETPQGARSWNRRVRRLQQDILEHLALRLPD